MQRSTTTVSMPIASTLPRPWEVEQGFHDVLYEWMQRAPWLAISAAFHLFLFFVLMAIPWDAFREEPPVVLEARLPASVEEFEDPPEPPPEPTQVERTDLEEPVLIDATDDVEDPPEPTDASSDPLDLSEPADALDLAPIGLGGPPPKYGGRGLGGPGRGRGTGQATELAVRSALDWLRAHQSADGHWDGDDFPSCCGSIGDTVCDGIGSPVHDVGLTALALLAFLGQGYTMGAGEHHAVVERGIRWLRAQQDSVTGMLGGDTSHDAVYDHALGTLALCEAYLMTRSPQLRGPAQQAVNRAVRARSPYGAWRYDFPPTGDADTSVTGWMVLALTSARDAGLVVDPAAFEGALSWLDEVTDTATGRVGYDSFGSLSSRTPANERYPRELGEAMTAVGLLCRVFLGQEPEDTPVMLRHAALLRRRLPVWEPAALGCDMYYWYYGTYAMYQLGGEDWRVWQRAMKAAIVDTQRTDGDERGSWDPVGPWGHVGGRIYSTALMTLCLEVYYRYGRVLGAR